jgi:hypothetical protein
MGTKARPSQLRAPAEVCQWQARQARRTAQAVWSRTSPGQGYTWQAYTKAVLEQILIAIPIKVAVIGSEPDTGRRAWHAAGAGHSAATI